MRATTPMMLIMAVEVVGTLVAKAINTALPPKGKQPEQTAIEDLPPVAIPANAVVRGGGSRARRVARQEESNG